MIFPFLIGRLAIHAARFKPKADACAIMTAEKNTTNELHPLEEN